MKKYKLVRSILNFSKALFIFLITMMMITKYFQFNFSVLICVVLSTVVASVYFYVFRNKIDNERLIMKTISTLFFIFIYFINF